MSDPFSKSKRGPKGRRGDRGVRGEQGAQGPAGDAGVPGHIPASSIQPEVTTWKTGKLILVLLLIFGLGLIVSGVGSAVAVGIANGTSNKVDRRSVDRDKQTRGLINRIDTQQQQIKALTNKVASNQAKTTAVLCNAIVSSLKNQPPTDAAQRQLTIKFLKDYGCKVPTDLFPAK